MKKIAISIGDINGIGMQILLLAHDEVCKICEPFYFIHHTLFAKVSELLKIKTKNPINLVHFSNGLNNHFAFIEKKSNLNIYEFISKLDFDVDVFFDLNPANLDEKSGLYSYLSFQAASNCALGILDALVTLPINKKTWQMAGINYKGHTEALRAFFQKEAIMMLGCSKLFVALFTEHIALKEVYKEIKAYKLAKFLIDFHKCTLFENIGVLAFNPHASDNGVIGGLEELEIKKAIKMANIFLNHQNMDLKKLENDEFLSNFADEKGVFLNSPLVADTAFTPFSLQKCHILVSMYHDLALAPLKALYFEESVNISLNLPIIRTSVDHGTAYDRAYKNEKISLKSYMQAFKSALYFSKIKENISKNY